jgi:predicted ester cyclase
MQSDFNRDLVLNFYQAFDDRQIEQGLNGLSPDFVAHQAGVPEPLDVEGFRKFGMAFYLAFSQGQHVFDEVIAFYA